ncbi:MAG: cysteine desulfurase family protein [Alphaproteobacteria bacterium]
MIYLDNNASMTLYPQVIDSIRAVLEVTANSGAVHTMGRNARAKTEVAREAIANLINCKTEDVLFTSGATEANNMAIMGGGEELALVSATEHPSVINVHPNTEVIPIDKNGVIDLSWLENRLKDMEPGKVVVSVMYASHETGVKQPVKEVAKICAKNMQRFHMDAVQGFGKDEIDFNTLGAHSISITAHKMGGVQGIGALIYDRALGLNQLMRGGGQEKGIRPGTPNVSGIVGFGIACDICRETMDSKTKHLNDLRDYMESEVVKRCQTVEVVSAGGERLAGTSRLIMPNVSAEKQVMFMDINGICVSSGAACSSGVVKEVRTLVEMGYEKGYVDCSIRLGMSFATTKEDIDKFINVYCDMYSSMAK